jgi:hypothetical protein
LLQVDEEPETDTFNMVDPLGEFCLKEEVRLAGCYSYNWLFDYAFVSRFVRKRHAQSKMLWDIIKLYHEPLTVVAMYFCVTDAYGLFLVITPFSRPTSTFSTRKDLLWNLNRIQEFLNHQLTTSTIKNNASTRNT